MSASSVGNGFSCHLTRDIVSGAKDSRNDIRRSLFRQELKTLREPMPDICKIHNKVLETRKTGKNVCPICQNPWYNEVWEIVHKKNKNVLIIAEGEPGDGKSYISLRIGESLDDSFNYKTIDQRVVFKPKYFAKIVSEESLKKGNIIVIEEGGVQADHRKWHSFNNMVINYILQTFRYQNLIVIFNVPVIDYIDSDSRKLFKFHIETTGIDYKNNMNSFKIKRQTYNSATKKIYRKFLRYMIDGQWLRLNKWKTRIPSAKLRHRYEDLHKQFKHELVESLYTKMTIMEREAKSSERRKTINIDEAIVTVMQNPKRYIKLYGGRIVVSQPLIERDFKIGRSLAQRIKVSAETKLRDKELDGDVQPK